MRLSVIIPCFNAASTIGTQLEALANQQWSEPWEVIISDNGSTDGLRDVVKTYEGRLPGFRVIDASAKRGRGYARNVAVHVARGESLAFCDADDEVASGWLSVMGEAVSKYDFVACRIDVFKLSPLWVASLRNHSQASGLQTRGAPPSFSHAGGQRSRSSDGCMMKLVDLMKRLPVIRIQTTVGKFSSQGHSFILCRIRWYMFAYEGT